jgi:hypothetical protein
MRYVIVLLLLLVSASGWLTLRSHRQQNHLHRQLEQLTAVLIVENNLAKQNAHHTIKGIEAAAVKNRNQPQDAALLHHAETLQTCADQFIDALRAYSDHLHRATGNSSQSLPWPRFGTLVIKRLALYQDKRYRQALERRVATYIDTLRHLSLVEANLATLGLPTYTEETPVAEKLADLCQLESQVLAHQTNALQRIAKSVGKQNWPAHLSAIAAAKSDIVAPGDTYTAELVAVNYYSANDLQMNMACNGRPVLIGPDGMGQVRFRAPTRPGPATWMGTIRLNQNGRDTTFRVKVPYRVVRR